MQREYRWQRDVGIRMRQEGKASSKVWLVLSSVKDNSWRAGGESSPHLETHENVKTDGNPNVWRPLVEMCSKGHILSSIS